MLYFRFDKYADASNAAADVFEAQVRKKPETVLGLATGSSPLGIYAELAARNKAGKIDFAKVTTVNLDEYVGLEGTHPQSYRRFMNENLFDKINIRKENTFVPCGTAKDIDRECAEYDARIEKLGGIDLQLLGIGFDGHIGFNEPDTVFIKPTHRVKLTENTIDANKRFFENREDVPKEALTMGMGAIMGAKKIVMIVNGQGKKEILEKALHGPITPEVPASILQLHPDVTVFFSKE